MEIINKKIEWKVLDNNNGKALLISVKCLETRSYDDDYEKYHSPKTWENCSLRNWLNTEFLNNAFSNIEKEKIINSLIENVDNKLKGKGGNDTYDKVFLLSEQEVKKYSEILEEIENDDTWWSRSPGYDNTSASIVNRGMIDNFIMSKVAQKKLTESGSTFKTNYQFMLDLSDELGVCPAIWIDIS